MNNIGPNILVNLSILCQLIKKNVGLVIEGVLALTEKVLTTTMFKCMQKLQKMFYNESFNS